MLASALQKILAPALFLSLAATPVAGGETSAEALKQQIQQRSQNIKEFRALLNDPDQTVRLAALDTMLKSDDVAMRELAYGVCFNSADQAMRVICLKNRFGDLRTVVISIKGIDNPTENQEKVLNEWNGTYSFEVSDYDEKTGQFTTTGTYVQGKGQVTGTGIEFSQQYCNGGFQLVDGGTMEGELGCRSRWAGTYRGSIRLQ
ncbi:hypothetical protein [Thiohalobacter thiocyanaticus]|uniref:HEAT repeat domain-containing protein n=1 Tax=Thiohalobacter thiocyanaticus TaxID=585455 RepID=A0A426QKR6_9GAMM|nr:hypothetical protein [Thiohalobacter thiocyanaticus]RRQ22353.1 hypothetical protein D6C00_10595 [Thiohalobacter thiocyanaticus]